MIRPADIDDRGLSNGVWTLRIGDASDDAPDLTCHRHGEAVDGISVTRFDGGWQADVPCPAAVLTDGAHTLILRDGRTGATIATKTIVAGRALDPDVVSEVALLRAELEMLKRAFRAHCADTSRD